MLRSSPDRFRARENFDIFYEKLAPLLFCGKEENRVAEKQTPLRVRIGLVLTI
jgi:hypothetical protein